MSRLLRWGGPVILLVVLAAAAVWSLNGGESRNPQPPTQPANVNRGAVHVEVLNGCGVDGIAGRVAAALRHQGFDVLTLGNAESFNYPESMVLDRAGEPEYARAVAEALGIRHHLLQKVADPFRIEQVTVIVGRDYGRLSLPASRAE